MVSALLDTGAVLPNVYAELHSHACSVIPLVHAVHG